MTNRITGALLSLLLAGSLQAAEDDPPSLTQARRLYASYDQVQTLTCEIRKRSTTPQGTVRLLSRVTFKRPDRVHIENVSPISRRIIADGRKLYYHVADTPRGYAALITELSPRWLASLRNVPGTALEHLANLKDLPEIALEATADHPIRAGYLTSEFYVVLACDAQRRLEQIDVFTDRTMEHPRARYLYASFQRVSEDCWIPCRYNATLYQPDGTTLSETRIVSNLAINVPVADRMFTPELFFDKIEFVDRFDDAYGIN